MSNPIIPIEMLPSLMRQVFGAQAQQRTPLSLTLPKPYAEWQRQLMAGKLRLMVFPCATKVGKSVAGSVRIARFSFAQARNQDALYRIIAPTYQLSEITYRYLKRLLPEKLPAQDHLSRDKLAAAQKIWSQFTPDRTDGSLLMSWRHNGARIRCIHGQDPEVTIEGERVHGNVFDEASKMNPRVYPSALSTTSQTGGWNVLYSTPRGKNWFYQMYMECQEHMRWAAANGKPLEMFSAQARTIDSPYVNKAVIEQARKTLPERIFRQLYLAEFVDDGTVFAGYRDCIVGEMVVTLGEVEAWEMPDSKNRSVVIGADWAKRGDYTVFIAIDVTDSRPRVVGFRRTHGMKYTDSIRELVRFGNRFKEVVLVKHDRTGVGDVVDELLQNVEFPIEPVVFTHQSKTHMVDQWSVALSTKAIDLCNWEPLIAEHDNYDVKTNQLGKPIYGAIAGQHDDIVTACFLSWSAYLETQDRNYTVYDLDDLSTSKEDNDPDSIEGYYQSLIQDDGDDF